MFRLWGILGGRGFRRFEDISDVVSDVGGVKWKRTYFDVWLCSAQFGASDCIVILTFTKLDNRNKMLAFIV